MLRVVITSTAAKPMRQSTDSKERESSNDAKEIAVPTRNTPVLTPQIFHRRNKCETKLIGKIYVFHYLSNLCP